MKYSTQNIRKQSRVLAEAEAAALLRHGEYGVLSMVDADALPYGVPMSYAWDGEDAIYLHGAPEGRKLQALLHNNKVSFCIVGRTQILQEKFSTEYESIILEGEATVELSDTFKLKGLQLLVDKYSPEFSEKGYQYAQASMHETLVIRLEIEQWSGKSRMTRR